MSQVLTNKHKLPETWLEMMPRNLEIGSGGNPQPGYLHLERYVEGLDMDQYDVVADARSMPFPDEWFDSALMFGVFEHLGFFEAEEALSEISRVMKIGAIFKFDVPDFDWFVHAYISGKDENGEPLRPERDEAWVLKSIFGGQDGPGMFHKWGWNERRMRELLSNPSCGFSFFRLVGRQWRDPEHNHLIWECVK